MKSKLIYLAFILAFILMFMPLVLGQADKIQTLKQNQDGQYIFSCDNNGNLCDVTTTCNVSIFYQNSSTLVSNDQAINYGGGVYKYNLTSSQLSTIGDYDTLQTCIASGVNSEPIPSFFTVTASGYQQTNSQAIGSLSFLLLMIVLTVLFGWSGFKLGETKGFWIIGIFMLFLSILFVVYDVWLGYEYHINYTGATNNGVIEILFYIFMALLVLGLITSIVLLFVRWREVAKYIKQEINNKEDLKRDEIDELYDWQGGFK